MKIDIYGKDGCPKCFYCETKLNSISGIDVNVVHDEKIVEEFASKYGVSELPVLYIENGGVYAGASAVSFVKEFKG